MMMMMMMMIIIFFENLLFQRDASLFFLASLETAGHTAYNNFFLSTAENMQKKE
jgi:hypothetical protein